MKTEKYLFYCLQFTYRINLWSYDFVVTRGLFESGYFTKQGGNVRNMLMLASCHSNFVSTEVVLFGIPDSKQSSSLPKLLLFNEREYNL